MSKHRYTAPSLYRGEGEVWYQDQRIATVECLLGLFHGRSAANSVPPVKGGTVQLVTGQLPTDGEELLLVCSDGRSFRFVATHKVAHIYRVTPVGQ